MSKFTDAVEMLDQETRSAQEYRESRQDSPTRKVSQGARQILNTLNIEPGEEGALDQEVREQVTGDALDLLTMLSNLTPDAFDTSAGDKLADTLTGLLKIDPDYWPQGFASVADSARASVDAWLSAKPGRRASSGEGPGVGTPDSQKLATFNIGGVTIDMTSDREGVDAKSITHRSTFSSLSNEMNVWTRSVTGIDKSYQEQDARAREGWRRAIGEVKLNASEGRVVEVEPFTCNTADGQVLTFTLSYTLLNA